MMTLFQSDVPPGKSSNRFIFIAVSLCFVFFSACEDQLFPDQSNDPTYAFDVFWQETDRNYSFFDHVDLNWDSVYEVYKPRISSNTTEAELFSIFDQMLTLLQDGHANIYAPHGNGGNSNYFEAYLPNPVVAEPEGPYFDYYNNVNRTFGVGKLKNSTLSYLRIKTFEGEKTDFDAIDAVLKGLEWSTGLIIDVRSNLGGQIGNSELVAGRFADSTRFAYEYRLRNGPKHSDFTNWYKVTLTAHSETTWNRKPVAVLTNRSTFSAAEWFVLFMKLQSRVTIVGDTTGGGGAVPITRELPNGWILRVSNTQTRLASGRIFHRSGIYPDIPVWIKEEDEQKHIDTILETAIQLF
jgi:hypothetical protein